MTDLNGAPLTDGARIKAKIKTLNVGIVEGFGVVDFMEHSADGDMVALTLDDKTECFVSARCVEVVGN